MQLDSDKRPICQMAVSSEVLAQVHLWARCALVNTPGTRQHADIFLMVLTEGSFSIPPIHFIMERTYSRCHRGLHNRENDRTS